MKRFYLASIMNPATSRREVARVDSNGYTVGKWIDLGVDRVARWAGVQAPSMAAARTVFIENLQNRGGVTEPGIVWYS